MTAWAGPLAMLATLACGCGNDRPAPVAAKEPAPSSGSAQPPVATDPPTGLRLGLADRPPAPAPLTRTVVLSTTGGAGPLRVPVEADGRVYFMVLAPAGAPITLDGAPVLDGAASVAVPSELDTLAALSLPATAGPLLTGVPRRVPLAWGSPAIADELLVEGGLGRAPFARVKEGPLHFAGETAATGTGVIDLIEDTPSYQGPGGAASNARYVALTVTVAGPVVACGPDDRATAELDVTVYDRFTGKVAGKQRFRPTVDCARQGPAVVAPAAVRAWLASQFVRTPAQP